MKLEPPELSETAQPGARRINGALQTIKPKDQIGLRPMFDPVAITPDGKWMRIRTPTSWINCMLAMDSGHLRNDFRLEWLRSDSLGIGISARSYRLTPPMLPRAPWRFESGAFQRFLLGRNWTCTSERVAR